MNISIYFIKPTQNCRICCAFVDQSTDTECLERDACLSNACGSIIPTLGREAACFSNKTCSGSLQITN